MKMKKLNYKATCFSCKQGDIQNIPAQWFVTGYDGTKPFKGYVCDDHHEMLATEDMIKSAQSIDLDSIVAFYTGFKSFDHMIKTVNSCYTPTLRTDIDPELKIVCQAFNDKMVELGLDNRA
jgi:hypothetical protein